MHSEEGDFERDVLKKVYAEAGIRIEYHPAGVFVFWQDGFWVAVNY